MKRNLFGATIVAGGLALFTSVGGFAVDYTTGTAAETAVNLCASQASDAVKNADTTALKGEAAGEATALKDETLAGIEEIRAEAVSNIKEAVAEAKDEDGATNAADLTAELNAIVDQACTKDIAKVKAEFDKALAELVAESTKVEQPETKTADVERDSEKRGSEREGND